MSGHGGILTRHRDEMSERMLWLTRWYCGYFGKTWWEIAIGVRQGRPFGSPPPAVSAVTQHGTEEETNGRAT